MDLWWASSGFTVGLGLVPQRPFMLPKFVWLQLASAVGECQITSTAPSYFLILLGGPCSLISFPIFIGCSKCRLLACIATFSLLVGQPG